MHFRPYNRLYIPWPPSPQPNIPHLVMDGTAPDKSAVSTWLCRLCLKPKVAYVPFTWFPRFWEVKQCHGQHEWKRKHIITYTSCVTHGTFGLKMVGLESRLVPRVIAVHSVPITWQNTPCVLVNGSPQAIDQLVHANKKTINYKRNGQTVRCSDRLRESTAGRIICVLSSVLFIRYWLPLLFRKLAEYRPYLARACINAAALRL